MRVELLRLQKEVGITSIYVTHDQSEALVMSDRVVVMNNGMIQQVGDPHTIYARPVNTFVANFIGVANLMEGIALGRSGGLLEMEIPLGEDHAPLRVKALGGDDASPGQRLILGVRPEDVLVQCASRRGRAPSICSRAKWRFSLSISAISWNAASGWGTTRSASRSTITRTSCAAPEGVPRASSRTTACA